MHDFLIVGGGVIGLSLAWELARRGRTVRLIDRDLLGRATSWAGAGILPPPQARAGHDALEQLRVLSHQLHPEWSERLRQETGIDNQLRRCGGIYLARQAGEAASLRVAMSQASDDGVVIEELLPNELIEQEPNLRSIAAEVRAAYRLPNEFQLRSPRHLKALVAACRYQGVDVLSDVQVERLEVERRSVVAVTSVERRFSAAQVCLCSGPWSPILLGPYGVTLPVEPWRGQLILWKLERPPVAHIVNEGLRYLVPRMDGHLVVGATVEDVGYDDGTTDEAVHELMDYSYQLLPGLRDQQVQQTWAGLRPKTPDGCPFMGSVPGFDNLWVSTGHFRSGIHLSPASAVFMSQLMLDDKPCLDPSAFRLSR